MNIPTPLALATNNAELLRAIAVGPAETPIELAHRAGVERSNINRQLKILIDGGLVVSTGPRTVDVGITDKARQALKAIAVYEGEPAWAGPLGLARIPLDLIDPNPWQSRTVSDPPSPEQLIADEQLAESIRDKDVLQPIIVRRVGERYQQAFGHSRVRSARLARAKGWLAEGWDMPAQVRDLTDDDMLDLDLVENVQRADLHWLDEAEAYLRHAAHGKSAADIKRLVGEGGRKKRSIQDYTKMARELDPAAKARARLPAGHTDHLNVEQCKFMVGERKPKAAFELSPKLALAMVELLDAGEAVEPDSTDDEVTVRLHRKPVGGPLITLSDRALLKFAFPGGAPHASVTLTDDLVDWLRARMFWEDRPACLLKAAETALGGLAAGAVTAGGRYCTPELNPPEVEDAEPVASTSDTPAPAGQDDGEIPEYLRRMAGGGGERPAPEPSPAAPATLSLKPGHALAVLELAHCLQRQGERRATGRMVAVRDSRRDDALSNELVFDRLVTFMTAGPSTMAGLTPTALIWLEQRGVEDVEGVPQISDETLLYAQVEQGHTVSGPWPYVTEWLNPEKPASPLQLRPGDIVQIEVGQGVLRVAESGSPAASSTQDDAPPTIQPEETVAFWQARAARAEAILGRLAAAARQAEHLIQLASSRRLKATDTTPILKLLDGPLAEADAHFKDAPPNGATR